MSLLKMTNSNGEASQVKELLQAQLFVYRDMANFAGCMSLKCAVDLNVPDAIHAHGRPMPLSELISVLNIPASNAPALGRVIRLLVHKGYFAYQKESDAYSLTSLSKVLLKDSPMSFSSLVSEPFSTLYMSPWYHLADFLRRDQQEEGYTPPWEMTYGKSMWNFASENPEFNRIFNETMAVESKLVIRAVVEECGTAFKGLNSLVDVGGGNGTAAKVIAEAFPKIKCTVYDLPHVVATVPKDSPVEAIGGSIFEHIPSADAVFMKLFLHIWSDEDCIKILKLCKEVIPSREKGGKVMIVDSVMDADNKDYITSETHLYRDVTMLVCTNGGKERDEHEWKKIFHDAGFGDYKITTIGMQSLIEIFP